MSITTVLAAVITTSTLGGGDATLWHADTAVREPAHRLTIHGPATLPHGACECSADAQMYVRQDQLLISTSVHASYDGAGMHDYRRARNKALREMGLVQSVRTHVNPRHHREQIASADANEMTGPRGVIHIKERFNKPRELQASAPVRKSKLVRVVRANESLASK